MHWEWRRDLAADELNIRILKRDKLMLSEHIDGSMLPHLGGINTLLMVDLPEQSFYDIRINTQFGHSSSNATHDLKRWHKPEKYWDHSAEIGLHSSSQFISVCGLLYIKSCMLKGFGFWESKNKSGERTVKQNILWSPRAVIHISLRVLWTRPSQWQLNCHHIRYKMAARCMVDRDRTGDSEVTGRLLMAQKILED